MKSKVKRLSHQVKPPVDSVAKIKVIGVGGSGGSAVNRMVAHKIRGVEFVAVNTDLQALRSSTADIKIQIGRETTRGLGAGMNPDLGARSAEEDEDALKKHLSGTDMVFITCGLGGGTGTGAAPIIADIARASGALTVAVVTRPFKFEGFQRRRIADDGLERLTDKVDTIITIPNDRILQVIDRKTPLLEAFATVDEVLRQGVTGISELITVPGLVNVDFADVKAIMEGAGSALMGIGIASGENRAINAARAAIESPLLEMSIEGARGVLFVVTASPSLSMYEVNEAAEMITASCDPEAKVIFGTVLDDRMGDDLKVTVIATGFKHFQQPQETPKQQPVQPKRERFQSTQLPNDEAVVKDRQIFVKQPDEPVIPEPTTQENELDIPTFIRNKMRKGS